MGKLSEFNVLLQNSQNGNAVYTSGQTISGSVVAVLNDSIELKVLKVTFRGKANVAWTETHSNGKSTTTIRYSSKEIYFDESISLFGKGSGGSTENSTKLPAGQNTFPFSFLLPANLPSSFEGAHGRVRYSVKATIERPWKFDHNTKTAFTVADLFDLNQEPSATRTNPNSKAQDARRDLPKAQKICVPSLVQSNLTQCCQSLANSATIFRNCLCCPVAFRCNFGVKTSRMNNSVTKDGSKTICCWCCASSPIEARLHLERSGYVPGEFISVNGDIDNHSSRKMPGSRAVLLQRVFFHAKSPFSKTRTVNNDTVVVTGAECNARKSIVWNKEQMQLIVVLPRLHRNLRVKVPIIIGSIPLHGQTPYNAAPPQTADAEAHTEVPLQSEASNLPLPGAVASLTSPPTYAAAVGKPVNIADEDDNKYLMGQTTYTPQYAYYDWSQSAFSYNK